jgi:hypothetical protein
MEYPISELCDRYSISCLKAERIGEDVCIQERDCLQIEIDKIVLDWPIVEEYIAKLVDANSKIWDMEAAIRSGKDEELGLEEIGRRAIAIREQNKIRVGFKNDISDITQTGFKDVKINHVSTD